MDFKLHDSLIKERMGVNAGKIKVRVNISIRVTVLLELGFG